MSVEPLVGVTVVVGASDTAKACADQLQTDDLVVVPSVELAVPHLMRVRAALLLVEVDAQDESLKAIDTLRDLAPNAALIALSDGAINPRILDAGADDFISGPLSASALRLRVKLATQRATDRVRLEDAQAALSGERRTDPLTGVLAPQTFEDSLAIALKRARLSLRPLAVALIELDRAQATTGDLRELGRLLHANLRDSDLVGRRGHGFAVALPDCDENQAGPTVRRIEVQFAIVARRKAGRTPPELRIGLATAKAGESVAETLWRTEQCLG